MAGREPYDPTGWVDRAAISATSGDSAPPGARMDASLVRGGRFALQRRADRLLTSTLELGEAKRPLMSPKEYQAAVEDAGTVLADAQLEDIEHFFVYTADQAADAYLG